MSPVRAHFDGKNFVPHDPVDLPKGTHVTITIVPGDGESPLHDLVEIADRQPITNGPTDWSEQHDHYIHGSPKR